ncbi:YjbH domain-containing protein [Pectobacteriaceae bacterium CE90]|nr:YjbH domain-containing protein [Pectobacteriaceae bacterium CE90]
MPKKKESKLGCVTLAISSLLVSQAQAASPLEDNLASQANPNDYYRPAGVSQGDFGGVGLLQMPTARMTDTGEFSANYRDNDQYRRYSISMQVLDWLEATIRYTDVRTRLYSNIESFSGQQSYKDKSFDVKARLWREDRLFPQVSIGFRDIAGNGLFDSEYVVGSKRFGAFDFTMGIGWGNMAQSGNISNPFCSVSNSFCSRDDSFSGQGGQFEVKNFFHGPAAVFGGIEYQTPWDPLRLKLEYDSNDYSNEFAGRIHQDSPINVGLVYRLGDALDTSLSWERGNTLMWGITLRTNFNKLRPHYLHNEMPVYAPVQDKQGGTNWNQVATELHDKAGYGQADIYADSRQVTLVASQDKYRNMDEASQRAAIVLANHVPASVSEYHIVTKNQELPIGSVYVDANALRQQQTASTPLGQPEPEALYREPTYGIQGQQVLNTVPKRFSFSIDPSLTQSLGGPESFYMYQLAANASGHVYLNDNWSVDGSVLVNIINNYDKFNYETPPSDGTSLPRVRTWIREYVTSSDVLLTNLQLNRRDQLAQGWYSQIYGGYLEMMYAGVGGEVLYRPYGRSWAVGLDINYVKQRDWNDTLRLADYDVVTGHLTTYWELPFLKGGLAKISFGRYLAGDKGVTLDLSRRFDSGIVVGAYVTKTNVSAAEYGEGSFTKGIYVSIPFDLFFLNPTTSRGMVGWTPLTRDGGQMLERQSTLYGITSTQ